MASHLVAALVGEAQGPSTLPQTATEWLVLSISDNSASAVLQIGIVMALLTTAILSTPNLARVPHSHDLLVSVGAIFSIWLLLALSLHIAMVQHTAALEDLEYAQAFFTTAGQSAGSHVTTVGALVDQVLAFTACTSTVGRSLPAAQISQIQATAEPLLSTLSANVSDAYWSIAGIAEALQTAQDILTKLMSVIRHNVIVPHEILLVVLTGTFLMAVGFRLYRGKEGDLDSNFASVYAIASGLVSFVVLMTGAELLGLAAVEVEFCRNPANATDTWVQGLSTPLSGPALTTVRVLLQLQPGPWALPGDLIVSSTTAQSALSQLEPNPAIAQLDSLCPTSKALSLISSLQVLQVQLTKDYQQAQSWSWGGDTSSEICNKGLEALSWLACVQIFAGLVVLPLALMRLHLALAFTHLLQGRSSLAVTESPEESVRLMATTSPNDRPMEPSILRDAQQPSWHPEPRSAAHSSRGLCGDDSAQAARAEANARDARPLATGTLAPSGHVHVDGRVVEEVDLDGFIPRRSTELAYQPW